LYNSFAFTKNIVVLTIFNIAYNIKKKQITKNYIIEIIFIDINIIKIINIIFNNFYFNAIKI